jgi:hypothetical protein
MSYVKLGVKYIENHLIERHSVHIILYEMVFCFLIKSRSIEWFPIKSHSVRICSIKWIFDQMTFVVM